MYCANRTILVEGRRIIEVDSFSYLGATIDRNLSFKKFAEIMVKKAHFLAFKFARLRYLLSEDTAITLFKQAIMPHFDYCSYLVDASTQDYADRLQIIQNRMLRCIRKVRVWEDSILDLHELCEIPMLAPRRKELLMSLMYSKTKKSPPINGGLRRTRNDQKTTYRIPHPYTNNFRKSPLYRSLILWNKLPEDIQNAGSKELFKTKTKRWFGTLMTGKRRIATERRNEERRRRRRGRRLV